MGPDAVERRLREASRLSRLERDAPSSDMTPEAVELRLRDVSALRDLCLALERERGPLPR